MATLDLRADQPDIGWAEIAQFITLYEALIRIRPPMPHEVGAYNRAIERVRRHPLPIPASLQP